MSIYKLIFAGSLVLLLVSFLIFLLEIRPSRWRVNPARPLGKKSQGIKYSFTGAMSPAKKESAYLHLPTYSAGIIFHLGIFTGIINIFILAGGIVYADWLRFIISAILAAGSICGFFIQLKRISRYSLRNLSSPDDYFSNLLATGFQVIGLLAISNPNFENLMYIYSAFLILYIPAGKLRHSFYFFSSRIALGIFYGNRGVWPGKHSIDG